MEQHVHESLGLYKEQKTVGRDITVHWWYMG